MTFSLAMVALQAITIAGCQIADPGEHTWGSVRDDDTLFSGDHVQYFPAGTVFKLSREEAALKAERDRDKLLRRTPTAQPASF